MPTAEHTKLSAIKHTDVGPGKQRASAHDLHFYVHDQIRESACVCMVCVRAQIFFSFKYSERERAHDAGRATLRGFTGERCNL